jgi:hypothetical protein
VEPQVSVNASGDDQPEFQVFAGFNILFPGKPKAQTVPKPLPDPATPVQTE